MSPLRIFPSVLAIIFAVETAVMAFLVSPLLPDTETDNWLVSLLDATLMTLLCAPLLWWTIVAPLRKLAVTEQAKTESIVGAAVEGIMTLDERGVIQSFNRAAESIFGYTAAEIVGKDLGVLVPEGLRRRHGDGLRQFLASGDANVVSRTLEVAGRRKDGSQVPVALSLMAVLVDGRWLLTGVFRDLTPVKRMEEDRKSRACQQAVIVRLGQRALACDDLGKILDEASRSVAETLGVQRCLVLELLADDRTLLARSGVGWREGVVGRATWQLGQSPRSADGLLSERPVVREFFRDDPAAPQWLREYGSAAGASVVIRDDNRPFGVLAIFADPSRKIAEDELHFLQDIALVITLAIQRQEVEFKRRERSLLRAEHLATVAQVATGMAHELRNPLTAIKMLIQAAQEEGQSGAIDGEDLCYIEQEVRRMERHLQSYLDLARPRKPERRPLDLAELMLRTLTLVEPRAAQQGVTVEFPRPPSAVIVDADWEQVQQLLLNVAFNALDAMPRGGLLAIGLRVSADELAELRVSDTGPGIAPAVLSRLFQPFVTSKETGTGLGLVLSRRIAEEHGGSLTAANRLEGGACFVLRLPLAAPVRV